MVLVATQVKRRRGTNDENDAFAGAEGEITVDLTNKELRVHDGSGKTGGFRIGRHTDRSNCITEISQDIKLELNNGTLTLKAGSKVYVPNGVGRFDLITTTQDCSMSGGISGGNTKVFIAYKNNALTSRPVNTSVSGAGATTSGGFAFDTTANKINFYNASGVLQSADWSFPVAIISTGSSGVASSIDQIFNGFGYIGSSRFILPKMRIIYPDGLNNDGTLRNTEYETQGVSVYSFSGPTSIVVTAGPQIDNFNPYYEQTQKPTTSGLWYNPQTNLMLQSVDNGATWVQRKSAVVARLSTDSTGKITNFTPKEVFHAVDYSDVEYMAHQAMPSDKYINLTAGASGTYYTAPADGYFYVRGTATDGYALLRLNYDSGENSFGMIQEHSISGYILGFYIPVKKNRTVFLAYNNVNITSFRFYYANGAE